MGVLLKGGQGVARRRIKNLKPIQRLRAKTSSPPHPFNSPKGEYQANPQFLMDKYIRVLQIKQDRGSTGQGYFFGCSVALGVYFGFVGYGFVKFNWLFGVQIPNLKRST